MSAFGIKQSYGYAYHAKMKRTIRVWWIWVNGPGISMSFVRVKKQNGRQLRKIRKKAHEFVKNPNQPINFGDY